MRTGAEYVEGLRDGRRIWLLGQGEIEDVTTHPATAAMVGNYAAWYDRHRDPTWQDLLLTAPDVQGARRPLALKSAESGRAPPPRAGDPRRVHAFGRQRESHPRLRSLIALGILDTTASANLPEERLRSAESYRNALAESARFLTFSTGGGPLSDRFRAPGEKFAIRRVSQNARGIIIAGHVGVHTAALYADDVFILVGNRSEESDHWASCAVPLDAPGLQIIARQGAARGESHFSSPLSSRLRRARHHSPFERRAGSLGANLCRRRRVRPGA